MDIFCIFSHHDTTELLDTDMYMMVNMRGGAEVGGRGSRPWLDNPLGSLLLWGSKSIQTDVALPSRRALLRLDFAQFLPRPLRTAHCSEPRLLSSLLGTLWQSPQVIEPEPEILMSIAPNSSSTSYVS